jgi:hypothetical protein
MLKLQLNVSSAGAAMTVGVHACFYQGLVYMECMMIPWGLLGLEGIPRGCAVLSLIYMEYGCLCVVVRMTLRML